MLSVKCNFFLKAIVFFELLKAISFSILLTFRISGMRLFLFMKFFSLDLWTYNLNISRIWLIKILLFSKKGVIAHRIKNSKNTVCGVKVGNIKVFWKHWTKSNHKHLPQSHSWNMWNGVSSYKLQKEHSGDDLFRKYDIFY